MRAVAESHRHMGVLAPDEAWMVPPTEEIANDVGEYRDTGALAALLCRRVAAARTEDVDEPAAASDEVCELGFVGRSMHGLGLAAWLLEGRGFPTMRAA